LALPRLSLDFNGLVMTLLVLPLDFNGLGMTLLVLPRALGSREGRGSDVR